MIQEFLLDRVPVEPRNGAQPPGDRGPGAASSFQVPGEAFDVEAADGEQVQRAATAPAGELAQVQGIRLAGQAAVPCQEPGEGEAFGVGEGGLDRGERGGWGGSGHRAPPGRAGTGQAGPLPVPAVKRKPTVSRRAQSRYATNEQVPEQVMPTEKCSRPPNTGAWKSVSAALSVARISPGSGPDDGPTGRSPS